MTAGTVFEGTRKPLRTWFLAMWFITSQKNGASALGLQRVLGLGSYRHLRGHGCTNCVSRWFAPVLIGFTVSSRSMKRTSGAPKRVYMAGKRRARLSWWWRQR